MLATALLMIVVITASVVIHYEALRLISVTMERMTLPPRQRMLTIIGMTIAAHLLEIMLFAVCYDLMQHHWNLGQVEGKFGGEWVDFFYFSAASYTTLGIGDLYPTGEMRFIAGLESLTGLILIGWSTSFTYLAMRNFWDLHGRRRK